MDKNCNFFWEFLELQNAKEKYGKLQTVSKQKEIYEQSWMMNYKWVVAFLNRVGPMIQLVININVTDPEKNNFLKQIQNEFFIADVTV